MTARELLARNRTRPGHDPKRCLSLAQLELWLESLAAKGVLVRVGDDWRPTPFGDVWLSGCFPMDGDEEVAA